MNYWNINLESLPSKGMKYNDVDKVRPSIKIRPLSLSNIKYLCTLNALNAADMIDEVLADCLKLTNLNFNEILLADRSYLIFWLRVNSFISSNGYEINLECTKCKSPVKKTIKLSDLDLKYIEHLNDPWTMIDSSLLKGYVTFVMPTIGHKKIKCEDKEVENILNYTDFASFVPEDTDPVWMVLNLDALSYIHLNDIVNRGMYGIESVVYINCGVCGQKMGIDLDLSDENMFNKLNLFDILKTVLSVCKYTKFQITDDMSYTEIEVMQEVIKEMIKEEKEDYEKQNNSLNSLTSKFGKSR